MTPPRGRAALIVGLVVVAITAINAMSVSIVLPLLSSIRRTMNTDVATAQMVLSAYLIALAMGQIVVGVLADRFGRRPVLMAGMLLFIAGGLLAAVSTSILMTIAGRLLQGIGGAAGIVVGRAVIRDLFDRERAASVYGYMTMGLAVAPMVGPAIGGLANDSIGWRAVFLGMMAIGILVGTAAWHYLPETLSQATSAKRRSLFADVAMLLAVPAFWAYSLTLAFIAGTYFSFLGAVPFVATELLGMSSTALGGFLAFVSIGYILGNYLSGTFSSRLGIPFMIVAGNSVVCITVVAMLALYAVGWLSAWTLFLPVAFVGLGNGLSMPGTLAGAISVRPELAGTASGIAGSLQFGLAAIASWVAAAAVAAAPSALVLAAVMAVMAFMATAAGVWTRFARD